MTVRFSRRSSPASRRPGWVTLAVAGDELLEQHGEFLALLQLALEVDVVGERADEFDHRRRRRARLDAALLAASRARSPSTRTMRGLTL